MPERDADGTGLAADGGDLRARPGGARSGGRVRWRPGWGRSRGECAGSRRVLLALAVVAWVPTGGLRRRAGASARRVPGWAPGVPRPGPPAGGRGRPGGGAGGVRPAGRRARGRAAAGHRAGGGERAVAAAGRGRRGRTPRCRRPRRPAPAGRPSVAEPPTCAGSPGRGRSRSTPATASPPPSSGRPGGLRAAAAHASARRLRARLRPRHRAVGGLPAPRRAPDGLGRRVGPVDVPADDTGGLALPGGWPRPHRSRAVVDRAPGRPGGGAVTWLSGPLRGSGGPVLAAGRASGRVAATPRRPGRACARWPPSASGWGPGCSSAGRSVRWRRSSPRGVLAGAGRVEAPVVPPRA